MKVKDCMSNTVCSCTPETTIQDVAKNMSQNHVGCIPICNNNSNVVGIVTDRDIVLRGVACGKNIATTPVSEIMTTQVCCCDENEELHKAEKIMSDMQIKRIPVTENSKIVGVLTIGNLINDAKVTSAETEKTLQNICHCGQNAKNAE